MTITETPIDEDIHVLVPIFLKARQTDLQNFEKFLAERNATDIGRLSHMIKGNAQSYGFPTLGRICKDLEQKAADGEWEQAQTLVASIRDYLGRYGN